MSWWEGTGWIAFLALAWWTTMPPKREAHPPCSEGEHDWYEYSRGKRWCIHCLAKEDDQ